MIIGIRCIFFGDCFLYRIYIDVYIFCNVFFGGFLNNILIDKGELCIVYFFFGEVVWYKLVELMFW